MAVEAGGYARLLGLRLRIDQDDWRDWTHEHKQNQRHKQEERSGASENIITHRFMADNNSWRNITQAPTRAMGREEFVSPQHGIYSHETRIQELWGCFITARVLHEMDVGRIYHLPAPPGGRPEMNVVKSRGRMKYEVIVYMNKM